MAKPDRFAQSEPSRFVVGIDLGTTNSAVSYVDTDKKPWQIKTFTIPQHVAPGQIESCDTLPSFHYQPSEGELVKQSLKLPWDIDGGQFSVGTFAREQGALSPGRLIASAKSWLCHAGVDRTANLLPWHGADDVQRMSPVEASSRYLRHIHQAWNHKWKKHPLSEQDIILTLPASFDEIARELTVRAAAAADLPRINLIEEPQAAFYSWVHRYEAKWEKLVRPGQKILICDIGGGTSDFTLIRVRNSEEDGRLQFHRIAVGEHLILGGDNLDLALAHHVEPKLSPKGKLVSGQWDMLVRQCRQLKETLLSVDAPERVTLNLAGRGSKLVGDSLQTQVNRQQVLDLLIEGFFPVVDLDSRPTRQSGFQEFGLPYAPDSAISRYLAEFLTIHRHAGESPDKPDQNEHDPVRPDIVLFNGGPFSSPAIKERITEQIRAWFATGLDRDWQPQVLQNDQLFLAVSKGAAYFGMVRRGEGVSVIADLARSYYVGIEGNDARAVCLVSGNTQPGDTIDVPDQTFDLRISQPVEFPLYVSSTRLTDQPGQVVQVDEEQMRLLAPIRTTLRTERRRDQGTVPVNLHAHLSEIGTLELWFQQPASTRKWRLQFDVRGATETDKSVCVVDSDTQGVWDDSVWNPMHEAIERVFSQEGSDKPSRLMKTLAEAADGDRHQWPTSLLRRIWDSLVDCQNGRRKSPQHEARWLNLLGFGLRPGYGMAIDDWRVEETWRLVHRKLYHGEAACLNEAWILWRRVAGGLPAGQQRAIAEPMLSQVKALYRRLSGGKGDVSLNIPSSAEFWRLLGSLELLDIPTKRNLGDLILELLPKKKLQPIRPALLWSLGRLASRVPVYGPLNTIIPADVVSSWLEQIQPYDADRNTQLAVMQMARRTDDRYRDLNEDDRKHASKWLQKNDAPPHYVQLVRSGGKLEFEEQQQVFGESLPPGLSIR